ncbi:hypothetical protein JW872_00445 [Candidatus Babeliales bacterium]|nr:hypothetical protein [Candidatus Babeliales bacterium]
MKKYFLPLFIIVSSLLLVSVSYGMDDPDVAAAAQEIDALAIRDDGEASGEGQRVYPLAVVSSPYGGVLNETGIADLFCALVREERESVSGAVFEFNFGRVARALAEAQGRDVPVHLVVDQRYRRDNPAAPCPRALLYLVNHGCQVRRATVFNETRERKKDGECNFVVMHNKFFLFGENERANRPLCWTGSFNFTGQAEKASWENVVVLADEPSIAKFLTAFHALRGQSRALAARDLDYADTREENERRRLMTSARGTGSDRKRYAENVLAKTKRINESDNL